MGWMGGRCLACVRSALCRVEFAVLLHVMQFIGGGVLSVCEVQVKVGKFMSLHLSALTLSVCTVLCATLYLCCVVWSASLCASLPLMQHFFCFIEFIS